MCTTLCELFVDRRALAAYVESELSKLKLLRPYVGFVSQVRRLYRISSRVYKNRPDRFVQAILARTPPKVQTTVAKTLCSIDPVEWQSALPIDSDSHQEQTFLTVLKKALVEQEVMEDVQAMFPITRSAVVNDGRQTSELPRARGWLEPWAAAYESIYKCTGECHEELKALQARHPDEAQFSVRFINKKPGKEAYALVGWNSPVTVNLRCPHKPFALRKN